MSKSKSSAVGTAGFRAVPWVATAMEAARAASILEIQRSSTVLPTAARVR